MDLQEYQVKQVDQEMLEHRDHKVDKDQSEQ